jgi:hypothetical protein
VSRCSCSILRALLCAVLSAEMSNAMDTTTNTVARMAKYASIRGTQPGCRPGRSVGRMRWLICQGGHDSSIGESARASRYASKTPNASVGLTGMQFGKSPRTLRTCWACSDSWAPEVIGNWQSLVAVSLHLYRLDRVVSIVIDSLAVRDNLLPHALLMTGLRRLGLFSR